MNTPFKNSVVIVTGASRGIGLATAKILSSRGFGVAMIARSESDLRAASTSLANVLTIAADVSKESAAEEIIRKTVDHFGKVDALVNNAGSAPMHSIEATTDDIWNETIELNLTAPFRLSRACWPIFKKQKGGVIVNVSSAAARDPFAGFAAYGAAKAGLSNLGLSLAREGAADNIRVHTIAPAATETKMLRSLPIMENFPAEQIMSPDDVARVIVQCIDGTLAHTSGEVIYLQRRA